MTHLDPGSRFGPYTIEGFVAGGGMGRVYAAAHEVYGHPVALKVLHERFADDPRWHRRFSEEGLLGMQLKHPNVLSARDLLEHEGQVALVMDLVRGGQTLLEVLEKEWTSGLTLGDALTVFLRVVAGVEYLHDRGLVHGDLKPENVLVEGDLRDPASWSPKVTDFGTVALVADPVMLDGKPAVVASPRYCSPEHLLGIDAIEVRSDVYALGLLLHVLLSGEHASGARTVEQAASFVREPVPLVHLVDQPDPLLAVLRRATHPDPDQRHASCRELALAIRDLLDDLGLGLHLEDLQADVATEQIEERAAAQKALRAAVGEPPPSEDDTELDLGSVIQGAQTAPEPEPEPEEEGSPQGVQAPADDPDDAVAAQPGQGPDPSPAPGDAPAPEPQDAPPAEGVDLDADTDPPEKKAPYRGSSVDDPVTAPDSPSPADADDPSGAVQILAEERPDDASAPGRPRISLSSDAPTPEREDGPEGLAVIGEWDETAEDLPTVPAGARVVVSALREELADDGDDDAPPEVAVPRPDTPEVHDDEPTAPSGASRDGDTVEGPSPARPAEPPVEAPPTNESGGLRLVATLGVAGVALGLLTALLLWIFGVIGG